MTLKIQLFFENEFWSHIITLITIKKRRGCAAHPLRFFSFIRLDLLVLGLDELPDASSEGGTNEGTYDENP